MNNSNIINTTLLSYFYNPYLMIQWELSSKITVSSFKPGVPFLFIDKPCTARSVNTYPCIMWHLIKVFIVRLKDFSPLSLTMDSCQLLTFAVDSPILFGLIITKYHHYMSLVVIKPVFGVFDQVRHKPGCTATEDG